VNVWLTVLISITVGVFTGVLSSFAVWWFLTKRIRPRIAICPSLALFQGASGRPNTQYRICNRGTRPAHDVSISTTARMPSLIRQGVTESVFVETRYMPILAPGGAPRWALRLSNSDGLTGYYLRWLPSKLQAHYKETGRIPAFEFLRQVPGSSIRVAVFATDAYSKTREYFEQTFTADDIAQGRFVGRTCEVAEEPAPPNAARADTIDPEGSDSATGEDAEVGQVPGQ
jgi:hypothetical protein